MNETKKRPEVARHSIHRILAPLGICFTIVCWGSAYAAARSLLHPPSSNAVSLSPLLLATLRFSIASLFFIVPLLQAMIQYG